ncbi:m-AAA protease-interacting protein 1, mitochondrial-like isoform X2 [Oncorhynchus masou masou]|uniref:m-AAA protease-interacting protein 1, mitochondrial-like isoform X2 n=1 Tax=Oncorhynchus masou masou TaxID=90313 RepID=UPI003183DE01
MALPMLRGCNCSRLPSVLSRFLKPEHVVLPRPNKTTRLAPTLSGGGVSTVRPYSSDRDGDEEFNIEEFTEGSKQAFSHVSRLLSGSQFESLEGLVAKDLIAKLEEKCALLPPSHLQALSADLEDLVYTTPGDVGIYYDDDGRKFVNILMRYWYLTSARLPEESLEGTRIFQVAIGGEGEPETKRLLTANYEFQREFTKGVLPDWTITRIEHSKLLD